MKRMIWNDRCGPPPLWVAVYDSDVAALADIDVDEWGTINLLGPEGESLLHVVAEKSDWGILKLLLAYGADPNQLSIDWASPLFIAAYYGHTDVAKLLIDHNAKIDATTQSGETPIFVACLCGHIEMVELLINSGAYKSRSLQDGETPLSIAEKHGHTDIVKLLVAAGAKDDKPRRERIKRNIYRTPLVEPLDWDDINMFNAGIEPENYSGLNEKKNK